MNKNTYISLAIVVLVVGGLIYFNNKSVPTESNNQTQNEPVTPTNTDEAGAEKPEVEVNTNAVTTNSTVVLNGTVNPKGANTTFWYEYGESASLGSRSTGYSVGSGFVSIFAPSFIDNLKENTTYRYQLVAQNKFGIAKSEIFSFKTTTEAPLPPGKEPLVTTGGATEIARTTANIRGNLNPRGFETTYWFEFGESKDLGFATDLKSAGNLNEDRPVSVALKELKPVTTYFFRLNAQNQYGTVNGEISSFTTSGPATPLAPSVYENKPINITGTSVTLKGNINPNASSTTYWFEYGYGASLGSITAKSTPIKTLGDGTEKVSVLADISGLQKDTSYIFRLVAKNDVGTTYGDIIYFRTAK